MSGRRPLRAALAAAALLALPASGQESGTGPDGPTPDEVEAQLERVTPDEFRKGAHHWLILHGRYVCTARKPKCWDCVIADICKFKDKTPDPARKAKTSDLGPKGPQRGARLARMRCRVRRCMFRRRAVSETL